MDELIDLIERVRTDLLKLFDRNHTGSVLLEVRFCNCLIDGGKDLVALRFRFEDMLVLVRRVREERSLECLGREIPECIEDACDTHYFYCGTRFDTLPHERVVRFCEYGKQIIILLFAVHQPYRELRNACKGRNALPVPRRRFECSRASEPPSALTFYEGCLRPRIILHRIAHLGVFGADGGSACAHEPKIAREERD